MTTRVRRTRGTIRALSTMRRRGNRGDNDGDERGLSSSSNLLPFVSTTCLSPDRIKLIPLAKQNSSLVIILAVACIAAIALALYFALRKDGGAPDSSAGSTGAVRFAIFSR